MALLTNSASHGLLAGLLRRLQGLAWPARIEKPPQVRQRRHYPPQRDKVIEDAAMAREMFRL